MVRLETDMGDIFIELDDEKAPKSAANFLKYVESGHYDGTIFHRVIDGFMIQGGGMDADMKNGCKSKIRDDAVRNTFKSLPSRPASGLGLKDRVETVINHGHI